ncbi:hypothetical protein SL1157_1746 [Ruegeria lacuscaerulensis ITI-1157]|nr:hypothetical protein SL1157_1746 [Ruegeria lacuscaerulensis ITI-1157]
MKWNRGGGTGHRRILSRRDRACRAGVHTAGAGGTDGCERFRNLWNE